MRATRLLLALAVLALLIAVGSGAARGERVQQGNLIVSLDGGLMPLKLPRGRAAPVTVHLDAGLRGVGGEELPRVTRIELSLPGQGVLFRRGLPSCSQRLLRGATPARARASCGAAQVGHGRLAADVVLPHQAPLRIRVRLLAFNSRPFGRPGLLLYGFAAKPPTVVVLPVVLRRGSGRFGTTLVADLPSTLGPWPRLAHFELTLSRRYRFRGRERSYLSASCPIPPQNTAGFFSLAQVRFTLAGGREVATGITRGCRAR